MKDSNVIEYSALDTRDFVLEALKQHFKNREIPPVYNQLRVKRHDYHVKKHVGANNSVEFFDEVANFPNGNYKDVNLPDNKFYLILGLVVESAAGLVGAAVDTLDFATVSQTVIENGKFNFTVNDDKYVEDQEIQGIFQPQNGLTPNFFQLPQVVVLEPNNKMKLDFKFGTNVGDFWIKAKTVGILLEK
jgi:hypothetical protein